MTNDTAANPVWEFMSKRRSKPILALKEPGPDRRTLETMLTLASRVPDHGKLEPWRFVEIGPDTRAELAEDLKDYATKTGRPEDQLAKALRQFELSPCMIAVIFSPRESEKVPEREQVLTCGAVCLSLVNAALSSGWGAVWLSGWFSHERDFSTPAFGLQEHESIAGLIHIGTCDSEAPERERPILDDKLITLP